MKVKLKSHQHLPTNRHEREALRNKGQFWTPAWVADAMVAYVAMKSKLVFDPAAGRGAFYEALRRLDKPSVSFYGTDIDKEVLADDVYKKGNCFVEKRDFINEPPARKFKAIVANPPYIRHHRIDSKTKAHLKKLSQEITGNAIDGRAGYHIYFLIQSLHLLEPNGRLAFIMPADTCEGKFSKNLWKWIGEKFCIEAVITFDEAATPFPNVDTNAIAFMIKNAVPCKTFHWVKAQRPYSPDLLQFIKSGFVEQNFQTLEITNRHLDEGLATGLSRPPQDRSKNEFCLHDFASTMRGIATGSNEFFFFTSEQVRASGIPKKFFKRAIGRTKDAVNSVLTKKDLDDLDKNNRPTYLLSIKVDDKLNGNIQHHLKRGEALGLPGRALIKQRKPWYKMEQRKPPPLLFAYLGRRATRFLKNEAGVLPLTGFLCVYPNNDDVDFIHSLWQALNHPDTLANLKFVGKSYGSGAIKVEPGNLMKLVIPEHVVRIFF